MNQFASHARPLVLFACLVGTPLACAPSDSRQATPSRGGGGGGQGGSGKGGGGSPGGGNGSATGGTTTGGTGGNGQSTGGNSGNPTGGSGSPTGGSGGAAGGSGGGVDAPVGSPGDGPAMVPVGTPIPLPLVVTDHFTNRGWFGDASIAMHFVPGSTIIKEATSTSGPCASRPAGARGKCLQFTYTPPPGFAPPAMGAFLGVYLLPTLRMNHPMASPPAKVGDPNWGQEPGLPVAPGAKRVAFYAAADQAGTRVAFRAGLDKDSILLPEHSETLSSGWTQVTMPLAGGDTGGQLLGGFAWTIKDTGKPTTFYIDSIVWDGEGFTPPVAPMGTKDGSRQLMVINKCQQSIWVGIGSQQPVPEGGGFRLDAGQTRTLTFPGGKWSGRLWGRTGCTFDGAGIGRCETGDCGGRLGCGVVGGKTPATLAEITWSGTPMEPDFYDLSLVDGYNLPMAMAPLRGTHGRNPGGALDCLTPTCVADLNQTCPAPLRVMNGAGQVVGCMSACEKFNTDEFCCRGAHNRPETCPPFDHSKVFKAACPTSYSYAYDDATSTFTCKGEDYAVWFCP